MHNQKSLTGFSLFGTVFVTMLLTVMMYSSYTVTDTDLLILGASSIIWAAVLLILSLPLFALKQRFGDDNIIKAAIKKHPAWGVITASIYVVYFIYACAVSLTVFSLLLCNFIDTSLPFFTFFALVLICCGYASSKGLTAIGRAANVFFILIAVSVIIICFSLSFRVNRSNFNQVFTANVNSLPNNVSYLTAYTTVIPVLYMFTLKERFNKTLIVSIITSCLTALLVSMIAFGVLGRYYHNTPYPFYTAMQLIELGAFQRLDVIFLALWTMGMFVKVSLSLCSINEAVNTCCDCKIRKPFSLILTAFIGALSYASIKIPALRNALLSPKIPLVMYLIVTIILPVSVLLKSSQRAKAAFVTAAFMIIPLMSGCQKTQIQDRMIIKGVGIDEASYGYNITVQYIDSYSDETSSGNKYLKVSGKTIGEAMNKIHDSSGSEPFLGQNSSIIVGSKTAEKNLSRILDYFIRYSEARPTVKLFISETTAEDILTVKSSGGVLPIDHFAEVSPSQSKNDNMFTILDYMNSQSSPTASPTVSLIKVRDNTIQLSTVDAASDDGSLFALESDDYTVYRLIKGIGKGAVVTIDGVSAEVTDCKTTVRAYEDGGRLCFDIKCNAQLTQIENPDNIQNTDIEQMFSKKLTANAKKSLNKILREKCCDIYNLGEHLSFNDYRKYSDSRIYMNALKNAKMKIRIECQVPETGSSE